MLCLAVSVNSIFAQEALVNENNPPSLKWYQINTPHFRVLFPEGFDAQAQRMANTLEHIREPEAKTMGAAPRKISVILQNQSSVSNGFVSITPRRSEFYAMPSQNYNFVGNNDWLNLLAAHEYRHMAQFQHATRGFNRLAYYAFGANVLAGMSYVAAPQWFWEGDAVATETAFTSGGRGRMPNFDLVFRTNLLEGRTFNYHKQYLRSYKHNIPDHYVLGYQMVSYLRKKTNNPEIFENITRRSWNVPFIPFAFSNALKKESGLYVTGLYREMAAQLKKDWQAQIDSLTLTTFQKVNQRTSKAYTDYKYPQLLEDGSLLVQKSGIGDIETLVTIKNGVEKKTFVQGPVNSTAMMSATRNRVVWNEYRFDPRWRVRNYSAIVGYDVDTKAKKVIANRGRYAGAALSPDGYKVATIETTNDYQTRLVVLDYFSGKVLNEFANPNNDFISMPRWSADNTIIIALKTNPKGKAISQFNTRTGESIDLTDFSDENFGYPVPYGKYILYNSPISGIDNIYALDTETKLRYQITSSKYGAYNPAVSADGNTLYYNDQSADGLDVVQTDLDPSRWKLWTNRQQPAYTFAHLVEQEGHPDLLKNIPTQTYETKRYSRLKGIVNPYSWGGYFNNDLTAVNIGITSRDLLSTTTVNAGYVYDLTERSGLWKTSLSYQAWYPIIDVSVSQGSRSVNKGSVTSTVITGPINGTRTTNTTTKDLVINWNEQTVEAGFRIPLITTSSRFIGNFSIGNSVGLTSITGYQNSFNNKRVIPTRTINDSIRNAVFVNDIATNGNVRYNLFSMSAFRLLKQSRRDINSKWGQAFYLNAYNSAYGSDFVGSQFSFYGIGYFPGLFKHHSLWGYWAYQRTQLEFLTFQDTKRTVLLDNNTYLFRNRIPLPRGGLGVSRAQEFYSMSLNYALPICYPDIAFGPFVNLQRIRANGFFDYGYGVSQKFGVSESYASTGVEMKFDLNVMRLLPQFDIGFRYSYGIRPATSLFEILIGTLNF